MGVFLTIMSFVVFVNLFLIGICLGRKGVIYFGKIESLFGFRVMA